MLKCNNSGGIKLISIIKDCFEKRKTSHICYRACDAYAVHFYGFANINGGGEKAPFAHNGIHDGNPQRGVQ